jgi:hypothetical protein
MATKAKEKSENGAASGDFVTTGGEIIQGEVIVGIDNKLTAKEQGQKARGELDENGKLKPDNRAAEAEKAADSKASAAAVESGLTEKEKATDKALVERRKVLAAAGEVSGVRIIKPTIPLYQGWLTVSGKASTTGEDISFTYEQAEPTGEEGVYHAFKSYFPAAKREGMKIDPENKDDPTKRTFLERAPRT